MDATNPSSPALSPVEEKAFALSQAALLLDQARQSRQDLATITGALNHNVELWVAIQTMIKRANGSMPEEVKANLWKLGDFVIGTTFRHGCNMEDDALDSLININLQISEGLLEAAAH